MIVEHWTTVEETQKLRQAFDEGGPDALLKEVRKMRAGRVTGGGLTSEPTHLSHRPLIELWGGMKRNHMSRLESGQMVSGKCDM